MVRLRLWPWTELARLRAALKDHAAAVRQLSERLSAAREVAADLRAMNATLAAEHRSLRKALTQADASRRHPGPLGGMGGLT